MQTFAIPVGLGAPHAISLGEDTCTSANDPASILSTSILVELADPDGPGLPWRRTSPLHRRRQQAKRASQFLCSSCSQHHCKLHFQFHQFWSSCSQFSYKHGLARKPYHFGYGANSVGVWSSATASPSKENSLESHRSPFLLMPTLTWPPLGWENMKPYQKLQAWEFTALSLETDGVINSSSLPRPDLCSSVSTISYVFLGQPGRWLLKKRKQTGRSDSTIIDAVFSGEKIVHSLDENLYL